MLTLYRVLASSTWEDARTVEVVPRCGNDHKADGVNLNLPEAVEYTANKYFTTEESPVLLEVDTSSFSGKIEWREPLEEEPWQRPLARIEGIPVDSVISASPIDPKILEE